MSADNGIYILVTPTNDYPQSYEYRVAEMMAIENLDWDDSKKQQVNDENVAIENARQMFGHAPVFKSRDEAYQYAVKVYDEIMACPVPILEYGISEIRIEKPF